MAGAFGTPRPIPNRLAPVIAGAAVILLALPIFLAADFPLAGWVLGAVVWAAAQAVGLVLTRLKLGAGNLAASGVVGFGMTFRAVAVMVVLIAVAASDVELGLSAALLYAAAYTMELAVGLATYFTGEPKT
jgi:hypothetical protein